MPLLYNVMAAIVKHGKNPLSTGALDALSFHEMAGELAALIGRNIRAARRELDLNQRELAYKIEDPAASNMHVSEWERGIRKPSDRYMPLIADALGHPVDWFYRDHGVEPAPELNDLEPTQLDRLESVLSELVEQVSLLRAETAARDAEVLKQIDAALLPKQDLQGPPRP